jgi:hypothetical protein
MVNAVELVNVSIPQSFEVNVIVKNFSVTFPSKARSKAAVVHMELGF